MKYVLDTALYSSHVAVTVLRTFVWPLRSGAVLDAILSSKPRPAKDPTFKRCVVL